MLSGNKHIRRITETVQTINPHIIILFGSWAHGKPGKDSDIDLLVVTNDEFIPQSFKEKTDLHLSVSSKIRDIAREVPIDLLVYTRPMFKKFVELKSSFSREVLNNGIVLYESNN